MSEAMASVVPSERIALASIHVQPDFNPRRYRTDDGMAELIASIRSHGVIQPIVVRPSADDGYRVVAGERRYRAAVELGLPDMPAVIRDLDDATAMAVATAENGVREDITVAEEARLARRAVSASDGDHAEAARLLGWPRSRIEARMLLLHASDAVLDALEQRHIKVGHAELLSTVPESTQNGTLQRIIDDGISVADLKAKLGSFTRELAQARFDTTDCQGCPFNSATQASLFEFTVGEGRCSNRKCWAEKTEAHIAQVKAEQAEQYPAVYTDAERTPDTYTRLFAEGGNGVGPGQYAACQSCEFFGALISTEPGREGAVSEGICFNLSCHAEKVKAYQAAQAEAANRQAGANALSGADTSTDTPTSGTQSQGKTKSAKPAKPAGTPKKVTAEANLFARRLAVHQAKRDADVTDALSLFAMMQLVLPHEHESVQRLFQLFLPDYTKAYHVAGDVLLSALLSATGDQRATARDSLTRYLIGHKDRETSAFSELRWQHLAKSVCEHEQPDLTALYRITPEYFKAHTKSGMMALLNEAGFAAWYDSQNGEGAFVKLGKKKVTEIVDAVFPPDADAVRFDFSGYVPQPIYTATGISPIVESDSDAA